MRIDEIVSLLEIEYEEMNVFEFMQDWIKWSNSDASIYSNCTVYNEEHKLSIEALVLAPTEEGEQLVNMQVNEILINYTEDPENIIQKSFKILPTTLNKLYYKDVFTIDDDMGWFGVIEDNNEEVIEEE